MYKNYVVILNSRQTLRPCGNDPWVSQIKLAVDWIKDQKFGIISSIGMSTWELVIALAKKQDIPLKILVPCKDETEFNKMCHYIHSEFQIEKKFCVPLFGILLEIERDEIAISMAEMVIPISIRKKGTLEKQLFNLSSDKKIVSTFRIPYTLSKKQLNYEIVQSDLQEKIQEICSRYIIHWTCTPKNKWPDESLLDYYSDIAVSNDYPRNAFKTLLHIAEQKKLYASSKNIYAQTPVVCFTGASISDFIGCMRWRKRYERMSFEPYGVGIERSSAHLYGIQPVTYYEKKVPSTILSWLTQSKGKIGNWEIEQEYRCLGDFDLSLVSSEHICFFCHTEKEACEFSIQTKYPCKSITKY